MSRHLRSTRAGLAAAAGAAALLAAFVVVAVAAARPLGVAGHAAPLVLRAPSRAPVPRHDGLGRPGVREELQPVHRRPASRAAQFVKGAIYEGLTVSPEGGKPTLPWLARTLEVEQRQQDADAAARQGRQVVGRQGAHVDRRRLQPHRRQAEQGDGHRRAHAARHEHRLASRRRARTPSSINLKTPDSQFIAATLNGAIVIPRHIWSKVAKPDDVHEPEPGRLRPVHADHALHDAGLRPEQEPALLAGGQAADQLPRVRPGVVERRGARADPERAVSTGRTTSSRTSTRRTRRRTRRTTTRSTRRRPTRSRSSSTTTSYPYSLVAFRHALSMAIDRKTVSKLGEYGYAPPTDAIGLNGLFPQWVTDPTVKAQAKQLATLQPDGGEEAADRQRLHLQGQQADRPEGQPGQRSTST